MPPDFKRLSVFCTGVDHGGVIAARALHKSPSAVSYDLQQLERQFGARLFRNSGRRLVLTPRGRVLAASIERAYLDLERAWGRPANPTASNRCGSPASPASAAIAWCRG